MSPGASVGARNCSIQARKKAPSTAPSSTNGAISRSCRKARRNVVVCQWPCGGTTAISRSPCGARSCVRVMFVVAQVSLPALARTNVAGNGPDSSAQGPSQRPSPHPHPRSRPRCQSRSPPPLQPRCRRRRCRLPHGCPPVLVGHHRWPSPPFIAHCVILAKAGPEWFCWAPTRMDWSEGDHRM